MTFVDIGAGTGFFSRAASTIVGERGMVYALDMSQEMLDILKGNGMPATMRVLLSEEYSLPLKEGTADFTLLSTVLHENTDPRRLLAEAARVTKSSGKVVIIEWKKQVEEIGPPESERLGIEALLPHVSSFEVMEQGDLTRSHYYLVLRKKTK
jgi:ubiquinone/menaquinone biosynthesis C-methylase UbiE